MDRRRTWRRDDRGQASVEFVALVPLLALLGAALIQGAIAGWTVWSASGAARAGARSQALGVAPAPAARQAVARALRADLKVRADEGTINVRLRVPAVIPGLSPGTVSARARFATQIAR